MDNTFFILLRVNFALIGGLIAWIILDWLDIGRGMPPKIFLGGVFLPVILMIFMPVDER